MPREKDEHIHTGELLKAGECEKASQGGLLTTLAGSMRWSWVSRLLTRRTDDFRSTMEAENKLMDVAKDYLRKEDDLRNIGKILSADRSEREERDVVAKLRLANAERAYKERFQDNTISQKTKDHVVKRLDIEEERIESERLEAQIRRQENERRPAELLKNPPEPPKKKTTRFAHGVIETVADRTHGGSYASLLAARSESNGCVLRALVGRWITSCGRRW